MKGVKESQRQIGLDYLVLTDKNDTSMTEERCYFHYVDFCANGSCLTCEYYNEHKQERCERRGYAC